MKIDNSPPMESTLSRSRHKINISLGFEIEFRREFFRNVIGSWKIESVIVWRLTPDRHSREAPWSFHSGAVQTVYTFKSTEPYLWWWSDLSYLSDQLTGGSLRSLLCTWLKHMTDIWLGASLFWFDVKLCHCLRCQLYTFSSVKLTYLLDSL